MVLIAKGYNHEETQHANRGVQKNPALRSKPKKAIPRAATKPTPQNSAINARGGVSVCALEASRARTFATIAFMATSSLRFASSLIGDCFRRLSRDKKKVSSASANCFFANPPAANQRCPGALWHPRLASLGHPNPKPAPAALLESCMGYQPRCKSGSPASCWAAPFALRSGSVGRAVGVLFTGMPKIWTYDNPLKTLKGPRGGRPRDQCRTNRFPVLI
jgi:hypothetical protein